MNIEGLDYNSQREKLILPEYGREVQQMVEHAIALPTKEERTACAYTIVKTMKRMSTKAYDYEDLEQKLWNHLAIISQFRLDIDYPYDISGATQLAVKPERVPYPTRDISMRHYGKLLCASFEQLKQMAPGPQRDALMKLTANQMKRSLVQWGNGSSDNEKVASDLAEYTDGKIQLDLNTFKFEKVAPREPEKKRKKK
ncbi:MAG: DUF4290 domain-containing protein [Prevotella sp.]|nr:DUF4290 domain-containing protein [Prevotella sp.]MDD7462347.1 DUF4290 domain-containing protein [Prevotellaceae bacterium]MDY3364533.1 DUF4290 domain-containing protein [Prevotella sp.]MDY3851497.1 DUF4290 domain-containing protein [Prevotella sp.]